MKRMLKDNHLIKMSFDIFEREYANEIIWKTEVLLEECGGSEDETYTESEYDLAYEQAIQLVAAEKGYTLI